MEFLIAVLVFIFLLILFLPVKKIFPRRDLRKFLNSTKPQVMKKQSGEEFVWGMFSICESFVSITKIRINSKNRESIYTKLRLAGVLDQVSVEAFYGARILLCSLSAAAFFLIFILNANSLSFLMTLMSLIIGYIYPEAALRGRIKKRQLKIKNELPGVLNTLAIVTDAGLNINEAFNRVAESKNGYLALEFSKVVDEVNLGGIFKESLMKMAENCQVKELDEFVFILVNNLEKGAEGLTKTLREQAKENWNKRKGNARELAEKASVKLFFPMMMFALPGYLIFILGPTVISIARFIT